MVDCICEQHGLDGNSQFSQEVCELLGNPPEIGDWHCHGKSKEIVQKAEDEVKRVHEQLNMDR